MLATLPQLEDYMAQVFDAPTELRALQALEHASAVIRTYTGQDFESATTTETLVYGVDSHLRLSQRPVTAVTSVTVDGLTWSPDLWDFTSDGWLYEPRGAIGRWIGSWRGATVVVTYTHGYVTVPESVRFVCLTLAARAMENPTMLAREGIGSADASYAQTGFNLGAGGSLTDNERFILDAYRGVVIA